MSRLDDLVAASEPSLVAHARPEPRCATVADALDGPRGFVLEAVREAYLLHYGESRAFAPMDDDLRLLAGDALYALGLSRLADAGDLEAVAELAELISRCAEAESAGRPTDALWGAAVRALARSNSAE